MTFPKWAWILFWITLGLVLLVVFRVNIHAGSDGFRITQEAVHY